MEPIQISRTLLSAFMFFSLEASEIEVQAARDLALAGGAVETGVQALLSYAVLRDTDTFFEGLYGEAGEMPAAVLAWQQLLQHPQGDEAFKKLLQYGSPAGQLYGLCGLYYTDPDAFVIQLQLMSLREELVPRQSGCLVQTTPMSEVLLSHDPQVLRIKNPRMSFATWLKLNPEKAARGFHLDIAHGGYPVFLKSLQKSDLN